ncbi:MAG: hypothetical protein LKF53_00700 [Solobacterium sp.]|jgi:hypothetical protein|nr:hypothetical protein [Solobacterium sp.]MCH4204895.1 hypothetical protein [Solobacterium sp.]MCH4226287.1 hypothetical protein [Solobacterium sp.]MCH4281688.1 hypothetical protein [Solobacterium sp.]
MKTFTRAIAAGACAMMLGTVLQAVPARQSLPQAGEALVQVQAIGHTSDGSQGTLTIGSYQAKLYEGTSQNIVDAENSAAYMPWGDKVMIADHASQGFSIIRTLGAGATGSISDDAGTTVLTMASSYQGTNTGNGIDLSDGRYAENVNDGSFILYTCNDATGVSVTVTYWNASAQTKAVSGSINMYRLYNPCSGEHFYTASVSERDHLANIGWTYEGIGWKAPASSNTPVYRLYNPNSGDHHYTVSASERDNLVSIGWNYEGIGWYSDDSHSVPLYRQYNPNVSTGTHNYTTSKNENDWLATLGWRAEGIGWYGVN